MALSTFQGPLRSLAGVYTQGPATVVDITQNTTLTVADHGGKVMRVTNASAVVTMPAVNVTADPATAGPGANPNTLNNQGVVFTFIYDVVSTANRIALQGSDRYVGSITSGNSTIASSAVFPAASGASANISLNGTTTGGAVIGSVFTLMPIATNRYAAYGVTNGTTVATPFIA